MAQDLDRSTVLVVEDDSALRNVVVRMLNRGGYATIATGAATEGLQIVRQRRGELALAILDIVIPGMSGLDLATDLDREFPDLKILYISGYVDSVAADVIARRAPERMLLKPFTQNTLLNRVKLLLDPVQRREPGQAPEKPATKLRSGTLG